MAFARGVRRHLNRRLPVLGRFKKIALDLEDRRLAGEDFVGVEVGTLGQGIEADQADHTQDATVLGFHEGWRVAVAAMNHLVWTDSRLLSAGWTSGRVF